MAVRLMRDFIRRRPLLSFFVLAYLLFWAYLAVAIAVISVIGIAPAELPGWAAPLIAILGSWSPTLAAVIVTGLTGGKAGIRTLLAKYLHFRLPLRWYSIALLPFVLTLIAAGICRLTNGIAPAAGQLTTGFWISLVLINLIQGPLGEEAGWRGFALPRLQQRHGPAKASFILGLVWNFWHLPLWLISGYGAADLLIYVAAFSVTLISLSFFMTWAVNRTVPSLVMAVIIHFSFNASLNLMDERGLGLAPVLPMLTVLSGLYLILAIVVWRFGMNRTSNAAP